MAAVMETGISRLKAEAFALGIESTQTPWGPYVVEAATTPALDHPNQDKYFPHPEDPLPGKDVLHGGYMCVLADGATKSLDGGLAAEAAVKGVLGKYYEIIPNSDDFVIGDIGYGLTRALLVTNQALMDRSEEIRRERGISADDRYQYLQTTCLAAALHQRNAYLARVGNSHAFVFDPDSGRVESIFGPPPTVEDGGKSRHLLLGTDLFTREFIEHRVVDLSGGKILVLATDGVEYFCKNRDPEAMAAEIEDKIRQNPKKQIRDLLVEIIEVARSNFGAYGKGDDVTIMAISAAEESPAARGGEMARRAREEKERRVEEKKSWQESALEIGEDNFAAIGFRQTGNEIVGTAAFEFRSEIADGTMTGEMFTAMMKELNGIAKSYETQLGRPAEQKLSWSEVADDMGRSNIAGTAFETTGSRIVAAAGYRFRQGISRIQDEGAQFKAMMREINGAVVKYRVGLDTILPSG